MMYKIIIPILIICVLVYFTFVHKNTLRVGFFSDKYVTIGELWFMKYYNKKRVILNKIKTVDAVVLGESDISKLTDEWIEQVTIKNSPEGTANMFCPEGNLIGTVSQVKRKGIDIKRYFDFFAKKPGIKVLDKKYNITRVAPGVFINTSFITWFWSGLNEPIVARMTFVFHNKCIFQLHSSILPEVNDELFDINNLP